VEKRKGGGRPPRGLNSLSFSGKRRRGKEERENTGFLPFNSTSVVAEEKRKGGGGEALGEQKTDELFFNPLERWERKKKKEEGGKKKNGAGVSSFLNFLVKKKKRSPAPRTFQRSPEKHSLHSSFFSGS